MLELVTCGRRLVANDRVDDYSRMNDSLGPGLQEIRADSWSCVIDIMSLYGAEVL